MPLLRIRDFIDEVFNVRFQGRGLRHDLVSKAGILLLKQGYDNVRQSRWESAATSGTARSGR